MATTETRPGEGAARERKVDAFVFDCVCHVFNFDKANALGPPGELFDEHLYAFHQLLTKEGEPVLSREEFFREWSVDEIYDMVIEGSDTDMIAAQPLPLTDLFHDGLSPWEKCAEMAAKHPDRAVFWGSVNPLEGKKALDLMTRQVEDHGAKAFKFYNVRYDYGQPFPWRMDDPRIAYPVVRARAGARGQPDRRAQGRAARPAADRAHAHVRHGRRRGELPRHQLRHLPRRAAVARRGAVADRALSEPLRLDRRHGELHLAPAARLRRDAREDDVVVRGGQDHLRRRVPDLAPAVGARGVLELRAARATSSRSGATRS